MTARRQRRRPSDVARAEPLQPMTVRVPADVLAAAKARAAEEGVTLSAAVSELLREYGS